MREEIPEFSRIGADVAVMLHDVGHDYMQSPTTYRVLLSDSRRT